MYRPLADELRPKSLDDVVGQKHILGPDGLLRRIVNSGEIPNMVFYGPSGTGKTTHTKMPLTAAARTFFLSLRNTPEPDLSNGVERGQNDAVLA